MFNDINVRQSLRPNPDQYNSSHVYYYYFQGNNNTQTFAFKDCNYSSHCYADNSGGLTVEIYESDNSAPTVENITVSTVYGQAISIELDGSDVDGDNLTYNINTNPSNGTIAFTGNSTISYNPNSGFTGNDSFTYSASDGSLDSNIATVSITVKAVSITSPNGGETLTHNTTATITWDGGFTNTGIELYKNGSKILDISGDAGDVNSYQWNVPSGVGTGSDFTIKVYDAGPGNESDESDATFTIQENGSVINVPGDYNSIQDAINNASDGTKIIVASGTYNVNDLNITKDIILKGSGMGSTILDAKVLIGL